MNICWTWNWFLAASGVHDLSSSQRKCRLFQREVVFLGHRVTGGNITIDESKVVCVKDWPFPQTISDLRVFLRFANYYRNFDPGFSTVAEPLNECLRNDVPIMQSEERLRAFESIKTLLTTAVGIFRNEGDITSKWNFIQFVVFFITVNFHRRVISDTVWLAAQPPHPSITTSHLTLTLTLTQLEHRLGPS